MILAHASLDEPIKLTEGIPHILVLEEKKLRVQLIEELKSQIEQGEETFVLSEEDRVLKMDKVATIVLDPFSLDFNQKKIISKIQAALKEIALDESNYEESMRIAGAVSTYFENLASHINYPIIFNDSVEISDLIKMSGAKIEVATTSFFEHILNYMCLMNDILGVELVIFLNLHLYMQDKEIQELYKMASYKKIYLLLIESFDIEKNSLLERVTIIDKDLCVIRNF